MFDDAPAPRLYGLPPGADFPAELVAGLLARFEGRPPEELARVEILVNTRRMQRRIRDLMIDGGARLLPRLRQITDLARDVAVPGAPAPVAPLRRRLEIAQLVARLIESDPTLAPRGAVFELAESLAELMDEMHGEGVDPARVAALDVSDLSGHWARSLQFIQIVEGFFGEEAAPGGEGAQRRAVEHLARAWAASPPDHPVIVAGSTGSRGATALFMELVARLPQGAVVLPGFDFEMPAPIWDRLDDALTSEDHPQYRFARLLRALDLAPGEVRRWTEKDPVPARNALISLALRPAPVTDQWLTEGQLMQDLPGATGGLTLLEAPDPGREALAIALRLRQAAEDGQVVALITPDRMLTRRVAAALDRWRLTPDDSAGRPLALSPPGRFLRHVAALMGERITAEALLTLLKHPLTHSGRDRGNHLLWTRELELHLRRHGPAFPAAADLLTWAGKRKDDALPWAAWLGETLFPLAEAGDDTLAGHLDRHLAAAGALAAGPGAEGSGGLWEKEAGIEATARVAELQREAGFGGTLRLGDYRDLFDSVLAGGTVRETVTPHPGIVFWGQQEARVQGADLVILGGLNDGVWPELPPPDPWLNRRMRKEAGLLLPERRVGLSAHDFQQAAGAPEVMLTRALRDSEAETVMSRWLNRLSNLLDGLPGQQGPEALAAMRARGRHWLDAAATLADRYTPVPPAPRPAPRPPVAARPKQLSVTRIQTLIRDPYAVYARHVLGLNRLDPLRPEPDAPLRGTVLHEIFDRFIRADADPTLPETRDLLLATARTVLDEMVPWPTARHLWFARIDKVADWFLAGEAARRGSARPLALEDWGQFPVPGLEFVLTGKADRIDRKEDGTLAIYDYKTGTPPSAKQVKHFDKQLLLEAAMAEAGAFRGVPAATVSEVAHIGLGSTPKVAAIRLREEGADDPADPDRVVEELRQLLLSYADPAQGYPSRRAVAGVRFAGDYDHLARFGEWDDSTEATPIDLDGADGGATGGPA